MDFKEIKTRNELADFLGIKRSTLSYILYRKRIENCYTTFEIPKKSGGVRKISAPVDELKYIQRKLASALWLHQLNVWEENGITPMISHAFEKKKSIISNAKIHRNKRYVLNIDLENFFDSFHFGRVRGYFQKNNYFKLNEEVSTILAQLTCYEGRLPQGAPTSPILANMICQIMDMRILKIAKRYHCDYTRYADDLTFSTNDKKFVELYSDFYQKIEREINKSGFWVNPNKTRLMYRDSRQVVTGLVVNQKVNVIYTYYRKARAMADCLYKTGNFIIDGKEGTLNQLEGIFSFINQIDCYNNKLPNSSELPQKSKQLFRCLNGREKQYQKFLFYRYFYAHTKPLIITEGKTDVRYVKAALKSLYVEFPDLISKNEDGTFEFKISFLHRTKRLNYFFGIDFDGADTNTMFIKNFLSDKKSDNLPDYYECFIKASKQRPQNPVIFIFDNELTDSKNKKPLRNLVNETKLDAPTLKQRCYLKLQRNIYVAVPPLVQSKEECEIEDLFSEEVLQTEINGRHFDRKVKKGDSKHYGKEDFSKYVYENYRNIDFSQFIPLLTALQSSITDYRAEKPETV